MGQEQQAERQAHRDAAWRKAQELMSDAQLFAELNARIQTGYGAKNETPDSLAKSVWGHLLQDKNFTLDNANEFVEGIKTDAAKRSAFVDAAYNTFVATSLGGGY